VELYLPEPIIPSWDIVYHGLASGTGKEATDETFTGASFQKGSTTKVTDQEWTNRLNLVLLSRASSSRTVVIKLFKQSSLTSKRKALIETSLPVSDLMRSQTKQVISNELTDSKGGKIVVNLTCEVSGVQHWTKQLKKAVEESTASLDSSVEGGKSKEGKSKRKSKHKAEEGTVSESPGSELTDSFVSDLSALSSSNQYRDKFISYLAYKGNLKLLIKFLELYVNQLGNARRICRPSLTDSGSVKKRHSSIGSLTDSGPLNNSGSTPQSKSRKKKDLIFVVVEKRLEAIHQLMDGLLKDPLVRKAFLDGEYIQKVIEWSCNPKFRYVAALGLSSFKPLFFTDALQESLGRAGVIHFLIHILNPKTDFGREAPEEVTTVAMQILPYFSNRFHPIFVKADVMTCIENLLRDPNPSVFQRGIELMLFISSTKADEVLSRFLPIFDSSLARFSAQIKETGEKLAAYRSFETNGPNSHSLIDKETFLVDVDRLLQLARNSRKLEPASIPDRPLNKPIIKDSAVPTGLVASVASRVPAPPAPPTNQTTSRIPSPPPGPAPKLTARERNRTQIEQLSGQVARLLENPNADEMEVARLLGRIEELGTDEPEPEAAASTTNIPTPMVPVPRLIRAHVGLDNEDDVLALDLAPTLNLDVSTESVEQIPSPTPTLRRRISDVVSPARNASARRRSVSPPVRRPLHATSDATGADQIGRRELRDSADHLSLLLREMEGATEEEENRGPVTPPEARQQRLYHSRFRSGSASSSSSSTDSGSSQSDKADPVALPVTKNKLRSSVKRLTQEMSNLQAFAQTITPEGVTTSSATALTQNEGASRGYVNKLLDELLDGEIPKQAEQQPPFAGENEDDLDSLLRDLREAAESPRPRIVRRASGSVSNSSSLSDLSSTGTESSSLSSIIHDEDAVLAPAPLPLLAPPQPFAIPPPPPIAGLGVRVHHPINVNLVPAAHHAAAQAAQAAQVAPSPAPTVDFVVVENKPVRTLDPAELEELANLRVAMAELERAAIAPLQPILRLSNGQEERYMQTGIVSSLLTIMRYCNSVKLKESVLELVGKISSGRPEQLMQHGLMDALLSLAYSVCSQKPASNRTTLPSHVVQCLDILKASNCQPTIDQAQLIAKLLHVPQIWYSNLHETLINIILKWDLPSLVLQVPHLLHGFAFLLDAFGCSKLAIQAIHQAFDVKTYTVPDLTLSNDKLLLLARLIRDPIFIQKWLGIVNLADSGKTFTPLAKLIISQAAMISSSALLANDEVIRKRSEISTSTIETAFSPSKDTTEKKKRRAEASSSSPSISQGGPDPSSSIIDSSSSTSPSTVTLGVMSSATIEDVKFKLLDLFEGAIAHYNQHAASVLKCGSLGSFLLKLVSINTYNDSAAQDKKDLFELLRKLPYFEDLLCHEPRLWQSVLTSDSTRYTFDTFTEITLGFSSKTFHILSGHMLGISYLQKYEAVRTKLTSSVSVKQLAVRFCLEGSLWERAITSSSTASLLTTLSTPQYEIGLEIFKLLPSNLVEYLPSGFFEVLTSGCHTNIYRHSVLLEILKGIMEMPIFWNYVAVYNSSVQEQLIRLFFWSNTSTITYPEIKDMAKSFLRGPHALELAERGFFVKAFRLLLTSLTKTTMPDFIKLLVEIDEKQDYRLLRASWVPKELDPSKKIPATAAGYVNAALKESNSIDASNWHEIYSSDTPNHMEWSTLAPGTPIAIVAFSGETPTFGGVIPRLPKVQTKMPQGLLPPSYAVTGTQSTIRIVDPGVRIFYKDSIAKPTVSGNFCVTLSPREINFIEALKLNFVATHSSSYNGAVYSFNHKTVFPPSISIGGTSKIAIYSAPMTGTANLTCLLSICLENATDSVPLLTKILENLNTAGGAGADFADKAVRELSATFQGTSLAPQVGEISRKICAPGYEVSTEWKPVMGSLKNPDNQLSTVKTSGCFAAFTQLAPSTNHAAVLSLEYDGPSDPAMDDTISESSSAPGASSSSSASGASFSSSSKKISPVFTHFLLSCTVMQEDHEAPDYVAVFMSECPLPIDDILRVPGGSVSEARKAKWPVVPKSIVHFGELLASNTTEAESKSLVQKTPLVTIPGSCRANHIMIVGFRDRDPDELVGPSDSMGPRFKHNIIFSMILLGTSHRGNPPVIIPKFEHIVSFFKKASMTTSIHVPENDKLEGIIWRLGTDFGRRPWLNPYTSPADVNIILSHPLFKSGTMWIGNVIGREPTPTYWGTRLPVWFSIDLIKHTVCPTHFALRHGYEQDNSFIRDWALQGSHNGTTWVDLFKKDPITHSKSFETILYELDTPCTEFYRYFRVITYSNYFLEGSLGNPMMCCAGFDLFGFVSAPMALDM
jgi:hypothetical protein